MKRYLFYAVLVAFSLVLCAGASAATLTSKELIDNAAALDGTTVSYKGEIVTAIMKRGADAWANLNDGYNAIGIWCKAEALNNVRWLGNYKNEGDVLLVTGMFHRACPQHGGELDIHADTIKIEASGFPVEEHISRQRIHLAAVFFVLTLITTIMLRKRL